MVNIGDILTFGAYPQSGAGARKEPIQWIVLAKEEGRILCISRFLLDCKPYHEIPQMVTWATCGLRKWLNGEFLRAAFSAEEQQRILPVHLTNRRDCPRYDTEDKLFLLDHDQAVDYFESDDHPMTRTARTTPYARSQGAWFLPPEEAEGPDDPQLWAGSWWLRYPEVIPDKNPDGLYDVLSCVNFDDYIELYASSVEETDVCVRPALWLKDE